MQTKYNYFHWHPESFLLFKKVDIPNLTGSTERINGTAENALRSGAAKLIAIIDKEATECEEFTRNRGEYLGPGNLGDNWVPNIQKLYDLYKKSLQKCRNNEERMHIKFQMADDFKTVVQRIDKYVNYTTPKANRDLRSELVVAAWQKNLHLINASNMKNIGGLYERLDESDKNSESFWDQQDRNGVVNGLFVEWDMNKGTYKDVKYKKEIPDSPEGQWFPSIDRAFDFYMKQISKEHYSGRQRVLQRMGVSYMSKEVGFAEQYISTAPSDKKQKWVNRVLAWKKRLSQMEKGNI